MSAKPQAKLRKRTAETRRARRGAEEENRASPRAGFTLVELLLAVGLFSILIVALLRLVDTSLTIWGRTDESRELSEMGGAVMDMLAADVHALEGGKRGDLLADWRLFDLDQDGISGAPVQRLRLVRLFGAAELQRLDVGAPFETFERGLAQVGWAVLPGTGDTPDERAIGTLVRGERLLGDADTLSFFDPSFFGPSGKPVPGSLYEITGGVLWFNAWFASQTSILHEGWKLGDGLVHCAASWDAWNRARPDTERSIFNSPPGGMPQAKDVPLLPRRVRLELELERPRDLRFRTRLATAANVEDSTLLVRDGRRLPAAGGMI
ncbi:MAG: prepilin-type N-terminal cleavage/methylation domain-containing protein, partial [Planctomycetes bacterium]|nr:prepilin-type N-terminal cleavage/methylation domain-containing protein [Planctomycetota bacterium]